MTLATISDEPVEKQEDTKNVKAILQLQDILESCIGGSSLKSWFCFMDLDQSGSINFQEFERGLQKMGSTADAVALFAQLDADDSGEITLEEICPKSYTLWRQFRTWSAKAFTSVEEFRDSLVKAPQEDVPDILRRHGWDGGHEQLFASIMMSNLKWLETEIKCAKKREAARLQYSQLRCRKVAQHVRMLTELRDLKRTLKATYGSLLRAWRCIFAPDDSLLVSKPNFIKACNLFVRGWRGNPTVVWNSLDLDNKGVLTLAQFDAPTAEVLGHFHVFLMKNFGSATSAFISMDKDRCKFLKESHFEATFAEYGFYHPGACTLFKGMDRAGKGRLREEDFAFLDTWKPEEHLTAKPNKEALEELMYLMTSRYRTLALAWRKVMDQNTNNVCTWAEFGKACKKLGFSRDIPGVYRALDEDCNGTISFGDLDPKATACIMKFKKWADQKFGGLKATFSAFDMDLRGSVFHKDLKQQCFRHGFEGKLKGLVDMFDSKRDGYVSLLEVCVLDEWRFEHDDLDDATLEACKNLPRFSTSVQDVMMIEGIRLSQKGKLPRMSVLSQTACKASGPPLEQSIQAWDAKSAALRHIANSQESSGTTYGSVMLPDIRGGSDFESISHSMLCPQQQDYNWWELPGRRPDMVAEHSLGHRLDLLQRYRTYQAALRTEAAYSSKVPTTWGSNHHARPLPKANHFDLDRIIAPVTGAAEEDPCMSSPKSNATADSPRSADESAEGLLSKSRCDIASIFQPFFIEPSASSSADAKRLRAGKHQKANVRSIGQS